jgi:hypothetical protein
LGSGAALAPSCALYTPLFLRTDVTNGEYTPSGVHPIRLPVSNPVFCSNCCTPLFTVTVMVVEVPTFPAASEALEKMVCVPLLAFAVFHE